MHVYARPRPLPSAGSFVFIPEGTWPLTLVVIQAHLILGKCSACAFERIGGTIRRGVRLVALRPELFPPYR